MFDNIKRTEAMLEEYEKKLLLFQKFQERNLILEKLKKAIETTSKEEISTLIEALEKLD